MGLLGTRPLVSFSGQRCTIAHGSSADLGLFFSLYRTAYSLGGSVPHVIGHQSHSHSATPHLWVAWGVLVLWQHIWAWWNDDTVSRIKRISDYKPIQQRALWGNSGFTIVPCCSSLDHQDWEVQNVGSYSGSMQPCELQAAPQTGCRTCEEWGFLL